MRSATANASGMARTLATIGERDLERELLRKAAAALRDSSTRCRDCGRTPLTGERVHVYTRGHRVCELCRPLRREAPERSVMVRGGESGATVRVQAQRACTAR
jgi:hypothetical protein